jgi:hypothetical protein
MFTSRLIKASSCRIIGRIVEIRRAHGEINGIAGENEIGYFG